MTLGSICFRHEPTGADGEIAGHLHPYARVRTRARAVSRRCFAADGQRMIMPAFGAYTGGLNIRDAAFAAVLRMKELTAHLLGDGRLHAFPAGAASDNRNFACRLALQVALDVQVAQASGAVVMSERETSDESAVAIGGEPPPKPLAKRGAFGPGLITGASDDDPSGIGTYSQAGAQFGFGISWTMLLTLPLMMGIQDISARVGRVTGHGLAGNISRHYSSPVLAVLVLLLFIANVVNIGADLAAMADATTTLIGGSALRLCRAVRPRIGARGNLHHL